MNVKNAIIQFLANEFHLDPENISEDTTFEQDLGVPAHEVEDLLHNLEDALNISIPEDQVGDITTVGQLLESLETEGREE
jgi:acyl carrier protein